MNVTQLETDLRAAKERARSLIDATARLCQAHVAKAATATEPAVMGRLMTDDEKGAIKAALDDAEAIAHRIEGAQSDVALMRRFDEIVGKPAPTAPAPPPRAEHRLSLGAQFTQSEQFKQLMKSGVTRGRGAWSSGAVECFDFHATTLTEDAASGGKLIVPQYTPGIVQTLYKRLVVADLMASGITDSNAIIYMVETLFTNAAAPVLEGAAKPESALAFDQKTDAVSKIAHWLPTTEELLEDVAAIASYIDARLRLGVQLAEEDQLLNGNGTAPNLLGIMNRPNLAAAVARNAGATPPETNADAILRQIAAIATTAFVYPDGIVMNPANLFTILTSKDTQGQYYGGGPFSSLPTASIWGTPVAPTPSIVAGTALVGAFGTQSQVFRKGGIRVEASNSHQDFFIKNLVAIRAEERLALAVYRPGAFGKVTGLN
jgi:HK97 family phage major capsid protein